MFKNNTWNIIHLPKEHNLDHCIWIYKTKYVVYGYVEKHKENLVANGFSQVEGIDYSKTFSHVSNNVFLHGELHE